MILAINQSNDVPEGYSLSDLFNPSCLHTLFFLSKLYFSMSGKNSYMYSQCLQDQVRV